MVMAAHFERVAAAVSKRAAELLSTRVSVLDECDVVVASSRPATIGLPFEVASRESASTHHRIPVRLEGQDAHVVVSTARDGEEISPRLAHVLIDLIVNQTSVIERLPNQDELKNKLIHDLLCGQAGDETRILREGQVLGMDLSRPRAVILIDASAYILAKLDAAAWPERDREAQVQRQAQLIIASVVDYFRLPNDTICAYIGDGEITVLKASSTQDLAPWTDVQDGSEQVSPSWANLAALKRASSGLLAWLRNDTGAGISLGIGRYHPGVKGLAHSYQDARAALSLGRRFHGSDRVHCLDSLGIAAFIGLSDERIKVDLALHLLSPLDQQPELLDTLDAFFIEDCCPSSAAKRLCIHRNTLSYRLDKIASFTGLDPRRFDDAVQIRLALALRGFKSIG